jgi:hypothetical protein
MIVQSLSSLFRIALIRFASAPFSLSSSRMTLISSFASLYSLSSRIASTWISSSLKRLIIFCAASSLPSLARMILIVSSSASKIETKPSGLVYFNPYSEEQIRVALPEGDHTLLLDNIRLVKGAVAAPVPLSVSADGGNLGIG